MKKKKNKLPNKILKHIDLKKRYAIPYYEQMNVEFVLKYNDVLKIKDLFDKEDNELYYKRIKAQLDHLYYKHDIALIVSDRQLILTSDGCISCIHLLIENNNPIINIYQRSSEYRKQFTNDVSFICYYYYHFFNKIPPLTRHYINKKKLIINYKIGSLHYYV